METTAMRSAAGSADPAGSSPDSPTRPLDPLSLSPAAKASVQILIVDDERTLRESCASMLKHDGYNVRVCSRGDEALETLKRTRFDIVLLDLYMAQVAGMELLRIALENHPGGGSILHGSAGILPLSFRVQLDARRLALEAAQAHERRAPNQIDDRGAGGPVEDRAV